MSRWTREQTLVALNLYCQLPFGKFHQGNRLVIEAAKLIGRTPSALAMKLCNLASLDPAITESGRVGLPGASALDKEMWQEFQKSPDSVGYESQRIVDELVGRDTLLDELSSKSDENGSEDEYFSENRTVLTTVRRKQHFFRKAVLSSYEGRCCMSGLCDSRFLVASHIIPWARDSNNRLNPSNGLCLSVLHDKAYDRGLITVTQDFTIRTSKALHEIEVNPLLNDYLIGLDGRLISLPHKFKPDKGFLGFHEKEIFIG